MDYEAIERLINLINKSEIREFEIDEAGLKMRMSKNIYSHRNNEVEIFNKGSNERTTSESSIINDNKDTNQVNIKDKKESDESLEAKLLDNCIIIKSPMVGTFYGAPSEGAEPFVKAGDKVSKGAVLCIVEAMKLMNEIECENDGVIVKVLVSNGEVVEYGQPLIAIKNN